MSSAYLSLGTNLDRRKNLRRCLGKLRERFGPVQQSSVYRSPAMGFQGRDFLNMVVHIETAMLPLELIRDLKALEVELGRRDQQSGYADRCIDIDLLLYGDLAGECGEVELPSADIERYPFVLKPLCELAPELIHPRLQRSMAELWRDMGAADALTRIALV